MGRKTLLLVAVVMGIGGSTLSPSDAEFCTHPNISNFYFNASFSVGDVAVETTVLGITDIFTLPFVPPQCNCSSNVTAIEFCYRADSPNANSNDRQDVFEFLSVTRDNFLFTINETFTAQSRLSASTCSCRPNMHCDCCDIYEVPSDQQFQSPSTFGVRTTNPARKLLAIPSSAVTLDVEQFRTTASEGSVNLSAGGQISMPNILLLRFVMRKYKAMQGVCPEDTLFSVAI